MSDQQNSRSQQQSSPSAPKNDHQKNNPLHGITLETVVTRLYEYYGWDELGDIIDINCFQHEPSIKSSLKFLRRTPWARAKVEELYVKTFSK